MKNIDYPAGHSMDSEWFAVDKDGNIGFFDTGDSATMPVQCHLQSSWTDFIDEYTDKISNSLHKLILNEQRVSEIINLCTSENVIELIQQAQADKYSFFEGFLLLNDGCTWEDLELEKPIEESEYGFAVLLSESKPLYYISDVYDIFDPFLKALHENKIKSCVYTSLFFPSEDECTDITIDILNCFVYVSQEWYAKPYQRFSSPTEPLNINQFSDAAKDKIIRFENLSFHDMPYLQPIEFTPCRSYGFDRYDLDNGYAEVVLSDNETDAFAALSLEEWMERKIWRCSYCNGLDHTSSYDFYNGISAGQEPKIIFIQYPNNEKSEIDIIFQIKSIFDISDKDWYLTSCVKCQKSGHNTTQEELEYRFTICHRHLSSEIQIIQPLLIVAIGRKTNEQLNLHFNIVEKDDGIKYIEVNSLEIKYLHVNVEVGNIEDELLKIENLKPMINLVLAKEGILTHRPRIKPITKRY